MAAASDRLYLAWLPEMPAQADRVHFFTIDDKLVYVPFFSDFGPNSMAQVSRFCEILHDKLTVSCPDNFVLLDVDLTNFRDD